MPVARDGFGDARSRILSGRKPGQASPCGVTTTGARIHPAAFNWSTMSSLRLRSISTNGRPYLFRVRLVASHYTHAGFM